jgi:O-antigen/teichoic acid export membrane protein
MEAQAEQKTLKKRAFAASRWVFIGHLTSQAIRFGGNLILTRLLVPEMFGVMAIVNVIMSGISMVSDIGVSQNVVQNKKGEEPVFLNTVWTIQILRGISVSALVLLVSFGIYQANRFGLIPTTMVYANKDLPYLLGIIAMGVFISSFNSIHLILLNRRLHLGKSVLIEVTSQVFGLAAIIYIAWHERTVYALACGNIVSSTTKLLLSHLIIKGRCRFAWDKETINDIANFGRWIMLSSVLGYLLTQGDRLLLGIFISPELLGVYTVAFFLANAIKDILSKLLSSVFYPVLSDTVRNRPERLKDIYYKIRHRIDAVAMFSSGFLYSTSERIIELLYDDRYRDAGWMMQILSLSLVGTGFMLSGQCFVAHGKSKLITISAGVQVFTLYSLVPLAFYFYGLKYSLWCIALNPAFRIIVSQWIMKKYFFLSYIKEIACIPFIAIGFIVGELLKMLIFNWV